MSKPTAKKISVSLRVALFLPLVYFVWEVFFGDLGVEPAKKLNHQLGTVGVRLIALNLYLGIAIAWWKPLPGWLRPLARERRWIGVVSFFYLVLHMIFYHVLTADLAQSISEIFTKRYLIYGTIALSLLGVLAATSNDFSVRKLGFPRWKRLHRLIYPAFFVAGLHVFNIEKGDLVEATYTFAPVMVLLGIRGLLALSLKRSPSADPPRSQTR